MRILILFLAFLMAAPAIASDCHHRSAFIGRDMIKIGDSARKAFELEPDREWQLETREGGAAGLRLDYYRRNATIQVTIRAGRVVRICRIRE